MSQQEFKQAPTRKLNPLIVGILAVIGAGLIVFGALAAPLAWQTLSVSASNGRIAAPALQIDSPLMKIECVGGLYEAVALSVVNIQVESVALLLTCRRFQAFNCRRGMPLQRGEGSGPFDNEGHIINNHVVEGAQKVIVNFNNGMWARRGDRHRPAGRSAVIKVTPPDS
jgi:S1-C subfamily serine protease